MLGSLLVAVRVGGQKFSYTPVATQAEAKLAVFEWIEGWYNPHRCQDEIRPRKQVKTIHGSALVLDIR